ncbi:Methionine--tRNA ligase, cytoplasmic [Pseudolycoriella hygida]|uniref:Methionine--tRNA ligase, cytoplasmic n=1 Tax=Pseudolycoriella hygida TaxID=35572 RepID=A0A9Q0MPG5_9DIPT|nr:Methionine--tRNA ligase, cytoplasmic [Pseudolycoriella hygida]
MIIYTNKGNPLALKLLISAKLAKKEITVEQLNLSSTSTSEVQHLPTLKLDCGTEIFSSNAAVKYLLPTHDNVASLDEWLEWSTTRLAPVLAHHMAAGHKADPNARPILNQLVKTLNDTLSKSLFLTGAKLSAADVAVWSLLAPDGTLKGAHDIDSLLIWYKKISELPEVIDALKVLPLNDLHFSSFEQANRFGGFHHIVLGQHPGDEPQLLADLPNQIAETVSAEETDLAKQNFIYIKPVDVKEPRTVLPVRGKRNVLITSALPYVNNIPHLGNIIGSVLSADIFARYSRVAGYNTLYVCGTDEYGTATETKALAENMTPQQICDKYFEIHNNIYRWFGIGFDYFGRTSTPEQTKIVQELFLDLLEAGFMETQSVDQLLCTNCDRFLADRFVEGTCPYIGCGYEDARGDQCDGCGKLVNAIELVRPRCKICSSAPIIRQSNQFFINLPLIEPKLRSWLDGVEDKWSNNARMITKSWLKEGLKSRCITRDLKWGIPVPYKGFETKVFYVWFDAPIGYMSITNKYTNEWRQWWQPADKSMNIELFQFIGKDNVPFHSVMFPSTLLGVNKGYTTVTHIMATEYLNYEGGKFSKSRGIGVFGNDAQDTGIPSDVWRFYLASARPEGQDSNFSWVDLVTRNNSELLNNLGNFINRSLVFCEKSFNSTIPAVVLKEDDLILLALVNREIKGYIHSMERAKFRDGLRHILSISRHGNQYMQTQQSWVLLKGTDDDKARAASVIALTCNLVCLLATLLFPFMPQTSRTIFKQLNTGERNIDAEKPFMVQYFETGHTIGKPSPLFAKIEANRLEDLKQKYGGQQEATTAAVSEPQYKSVAEFEKAIQAQGDKVRALKANKTEKSALDPEIAILLKLKKDLQSFVEKEKTSTPATQPSEKIKDLEEKIAKQGEKVRNLKASGDKTIWQPEVDVLLKLKGELTALTGGVQPAPASKNKKKK